MVLLTLLLSLNCITIQTRAPRITLIVSAVAWKMTVLSLLREKWDVTERHFLSKQHIACPRLPGGGLTAAGHGTGASFTPHMNARPHAAAEMLRLVLIKWDWSALNDGGRNNLSFAILLHRASSAQTLARLSIRWMCEIKQTKYGNVSFIRNGGWDWTFLYSPPQKASATEFSCILILQHLHTWTLKG